VSSSAPSSGSGSAKFSVSAIAARQVSSSASDIDQLTDSHPYHLVSRTDVAVTAIIFAQIVGGDTFR